MGGLRRGCEHLPWQKAAGGCAGSSSPQAALQREVPGPERRWDGEETGRDVPVGYLSGGFLLKCRGCYSHSFLPALFQFGGKEVLEWAIPAVLERGSAPRVSDGERGVLLLGKHCGAEPGPRGAVRLGSLLFEPSRVGHGNTEMREHWVVVKRVEHGPKLAGGLGAGTWL